MLVELDVRPKKIICFSLARQFRLYVAGDWEIHHALR